MNIGCAKAMKRPSFDRAVSVPMPPAEKSPHASAAPIAAPGSGFQPRLTGLPASAFVPKGTTSTPNCFSRRFDILSLMPSTISGIIFFSSLPSAGSFGAPAASGFLSFLAFWAVLSFAAGFGFTSALSGFSSGTGGILKSGISSFHSIACTISSIGVTMPRLLSAKVHP